MTARRVTRRSAPRVPGATTVAGPPGPARAGVAGMLLLAAGCTPDGGSATRLPSPFAVDAPVVGIVVENDTGCEVDAECWLRLRFADTVVTATYGFGERAAPPCPVPHAASDAAFPLRPGQAVEVTVSGCPEGGLHVRALREADPPGR